MIVSMHNILHTDVAAVSMFITYIYTYIYTYMFTYRYRHALYNINTKLLVTIIIRRRSS